MNGIVYKSLRLTRDEARDIGRETEWLSKPAAAFSTDDGAAWPRKPILLSRWEADHLGRAAEWVSAATPEEKLLADLFPQQREGIDALRPGSTFRVMPNKYQPGDKEFVERRVRWHPIGSTLANPLAADRRKLPHAYPPGKIGRDDWNGLEDIFAGKAKAAEPMDQYLRRRLRERRVKNNGPQADRDNPLRQERRKVDPLKFSDPNVTTPRSDEKDVPDLNYLLNMSDPWVTVQDVLDALPPITIAGGQTLEIDIEIEATVAHDEITYHIHTEVTLT